MTPTQLIETAQCAIYARPGIDENALMAELSVDKRVFAAICKRLCWDDTVWIVMRAQAHSSMKLRTFFSKVVARPEAPEA